MHSHWRGRCAPPSPERPDKKRKLLQPVAAGTKNSQRTREGAAVETDCKEPNIIGLRFAAAEEEKEPVLGFFATAVVANLLLETEDCADVCVAAPLESPSPKKGEVSALVCCFAGEIGQREGFSSLLFTENCNY